MAAFWRLRSRGAVLVVNLSAPVVADLAYPYDAVFGDVLSAVTNIISGATYTLTSGGGRVVLDGTNIEKGSTPFTGAGSFYLRVSHPNAPPAQQPYVDYGPYNYTVSEPVVGEVEWDIEKSYGSAAWSVSGDPTLTAVSNGSPGNSTRRAIQINGEIPNGVKKQFGVNLSVNSNRLRLGFALKGLFDPTTAGSFDNIGDTSNTVAWYPSGGHVQINGSNVATPGAASAGVTWVAVDTTVSPPVWYIKRPGQSWSSAISLPAGADDLDAILIPTAVATTDVPETFIIDNVEANWPSSPASGYSPLDPPAGSGSIVTATNMTQITNAYGDGAIIEVATNDQMATLVVANGTYDPPMTIRAAEGYSPKFEGFLIYNTDGLVLQGLDFMEIRADSGVSQPSAKEIGRIQYCHDITVTGGTIRYKTAQDTKPSYPSSIFPMGVYCRDNTAINITENAFTYVGGGINIIDCGTLGVEADGVNVIGNDQGFLYADDFVQASRSFNVTVSENIWHDVHLWIDDPEGEPSHLDLFQVVDVGDTIDYGPYTAEDNTYYRGETVGDGSDWGDTPALAQGIFLASQQPGRYKLGVYIRRNELYGTQTNAITVNRSQVCVIEDNVVRGFKLSAGLPVPPDTNRDETGINYQDNQDISIIGNTAPNITDAGSNTVTSYTGNDAGNEYYIDPFEGPPA